MSICKAGEPANFKRAVPPKTIKPHVASPPGRALAIASASHATGGKTGGIFEIFLPENIVLEPSQNVFRRPRESLGVIGQAVYLIIFAFPQTMELHSLPVDCSIGGKTLRMVPAIEASTILDPVEPFGGKNPRG